MIFPDAHLLDEYPDWRTVLTAYRECEMAALEQREAERKEARKLRKRQAKSEAAADEDAADSESVSEAGEGRKPEVVRETHWTPRLRSVDGVDDESLSVIHGRLIAYDFLKVNLIDRTTGLGNQVTPLAKRLLASSEDDDDTEVFDEADAA